MGTPWESGTTPRRRGHPRRARGWAGGYSIIDAETIDQTVGLMVGHPHLMMPGASIQVDEALDVPGMKRCTRTAGRSRSAVRFVVAGREESKKRA